MSKLEVVIVLGLVAAALAIAVPGVMPSKDGANDMTVPGKTESWTNLGNPSNGSISGTATLMKRTDPDTGATIYVLVGSNQGSVFVLPAVSR